MKRFALATATTDDAVVTAALTSAAPASSRSAPSELKVTPSERLVTGPTTAPAPGDRFVFDDRGTGHYSTASGTVAVGGTVTTATFAFHLAQ